MNKPKKRVRNAHRWLRVRIAILGLALVAAGLLVVGRAFHLQVMERSTLRQMAENQHLRDVRVPSKRGTIFDRQGAELAVSVEVDSVFANPRQLRASGVDPERAARRLASVLDVDAARLAERLKSDRYFAWIKRRVTPAEAATIQKLDIAGVQLASEARRFYPNRHLAAHLIGFSNVDGQGIEGLELAYEHKLRGSDRRVEAVRDRRGRVVFSDALLDDRKTQGHNVVLTIDKTIQRAAERELALAVRTFEARGGSVVVMNPVSGELLAIANYPPFNPNEPGASPTAHRRNRAVTDRFEPGSTVKPFTIAAALAAKAIRADQMIDCGNGAMRIANVTIHDAHPYEDLAPTQILAYSSNVGTAKIASMLGRKQLYRSLRRFGFGEPTGLDLPGETAGILRHYRRWYEIDTATVSFGQGMSSTNVQLATAMSAIANGGELMRPMLVRRVTDADGHVIDEMHPEVRRRVVPRRVARLVSDMLTAVTERGGTAVEAGIDGYLVAGKTGTAQKADYVHGGYAKDKWLASFAGFVPADHPQLVISVVVDEPTIAHYGGTVAAPVFRRVGQSALRHLGIPPRDIGAAFAKQTKGRRDIVQRPKPTPRRGLATADPGYSAVPDLIGQALRRAVVTLHARSLVARVDGSGVVIAQEPSPGALLPHGGKVHLSLARPEFEDREPIVEPPLTTIAAAPSKDRSAAP